MITENKDFKLPKEIDLLFDNKKLDILIYLGILYSVKENIKENKVNIEQLLYYYSVIYFVNQGTNDPIINKYLRDKSRINDIMIYLENLNFVKIYGDIYITVSKLNFSITEKGIETIKSLESESIKLYLDDIYNITHKYPYKTTAGRFKFLLYEGEL